NQGLIFGFDNYGITFNANIVTLDNTGTILGRDAGVVLSANGSINNDTASSIVNRGEIASDQVGILVLKGIVTIINDETGVIQGNDAAILSPAYGSGAIGLVNHGTINGDINCLVPGASDIIENYSTINGVVRLFGSSDYFLSGPNGTSGEIICGSGKD